MPGADVFAARAGHEVQRVPGAVALAVVGGVRQVLRLALAGHAEDGLLRALGHQDVLVAPVGDIDVEHFLRVGHAARLPARAQRLSVAADLAFAELAGGAVDRLVELPVGVAELVDRHVAGAVEHCPALGVGQLGKGQVTVAGRVDAGVVAAGPVGRRHRPQRHLLVAGVGPVHHHRMRRRRGLARGVVEVVVALDQHLEEAARHRRIRVVVAHLRQRDVHRLVTAAHHHPLGAHLFGDLRVDVADLRHQLLAGRGLDGVDHHLHLALDQAVIRPQHGLQGGHGGIGVERDRTAGAQGHRAHRIDHALAPDQDAAAEQIGTGHRALQLRPQPRRPHAGVDGDVACRHQRAADLHAVVGAEQRPAVDASDFDRAVDVHVGRDEVQQLAGLGDGRVQPRHHGAARHLQVVARGQIQLGVHAAGVHIAARQQVDVAALHGEAVAHVDVAHQVHVTRQRHDAHGAHLGPAQRGAFHLTLAHHAGDGDAVHRFDVQRAADRGVERAAAEVVAAAVDADQLHVDADAGAVDAGAQGQRVLGAHDAADVDGRAGSQRDVGAGIERGHRAAHHQVTVGLDRQLALVQRRAGGLGGAGAADVGPLRRGQRAGEGRRALADLLQHGDNRAVAGGRQGGGVVDGAGQGPGQQFARGASHGIDAEVSAVDRRRVARPGHRVPAGQVDGGGRGSGRDSGRAQRAGKGLAGRDDGGARQLRTADAGEGDDGAVALGLVGGLGVDRGHQAAEQVVEVVAIDGRLREDLAAHGDGVARACHQLPAAGVHRSLGPAAAAGGVDPHAAGGGHLVADAAAAGRARLQAQAAGRRHLAAEVVGQAAHHQLPGGLEVDGGALAGGGGLRHRGGAEVQAPVHSRVVADGVVATGQHRALDLDHRTFASYHAARTAAVDLRVAADAQQAAGQQVDAAIGFEDHRAGVAGGVAQADVVAGLQLHRMAGRLGADHHAPDVDVVGGRHAHRPQQADGAVQAHVVGGADGQLMVVVGKGGAAAAQHARHVHVAPGQHHRRAGLQPACAFLRAGQDGQVATHRGDLQQRQPRAVLADGVADLDIVEAGHDDAAALAQGLEARGAGGAQADLALLHPAAGVDDDVALGGQVALQRERAVAIDEDVGIGAAGDEVALDGDSAGRAHQHRPAQRLDQAGGGEVDRQRPGGAGAGVHVDAAVRADGAGNGDGAGRRIGAAQVDHRPGLGRVDGIGPRRHGAAGGGRSGGRSGGGHIGDLREAQALGATAGHCGDAQFLVAGEFDAAVVEPRRHPPGQRTGGDQGVDVGHQDAQAVVAGAAVDGQRQHCFQVGAAVLDDQPQAGSLAQVAVGKLGKAVGDELLRPHRCQHRQVAAGRQGDAAVLAPGAELHVALDHQAFIGPRVVGGDGMAAAAAAHVDGLAGQQVAAQRDLLVGQDADGRIAAEGVDQAAQVEAGGVVAVDHLATGHQLAHQPGVLRSVDGDQAIGVGHRHHGCAGQAHADVVGIGAARQRDAGQRTHARAHFDLDTGVAERGHTQVQLAAGGDAHHRVFIRPGNGLGGQPALAVEGLRGLAARQHHAAQRDTADRLDLDQAAGVVAGDARGGEAGDGVEDHRHEAVVGARHAGGDQANRLGGGDRVVDQDLLTGGDGDGGIGAEPGDTGVATHAAGDQRTVQFDIDRAGDGDVRPGLLRGECRGGVHIDADAVQRRAGSLGAATLQRDVAVHLGLALPVDAAVGPDDQIGAGAQQLDLAAHHHGVVGHVDDEVGVVLQRGDGAGEQKACAALAHQRVRVLHQQPVGHAVVVAVFDIDQVASGAVVQQPAPSGHVRRVGVAVVDGEAGHQLAAGGRGGVDVHRAAVTLQPGLFQHQGGLLGGQVGEAGGGGRQVDAAPADGVVAVVGACGEAQTPALRSRRIGLVEHQPIPAAVALLGQHAVLLVERQVGPGGARSSRHHAAPVERGGVVVGAGGRPLHQGVDDRQAGTAELDIDLPVDGVVAQLGQHDGALSQAQAFEAGAGGRHGGAAEVDLAQVVGAATFGKAADPARIDGGGGLEEVHAAEALVAQRTGHHVLLRGAEAGECSASRRRTGSAPGDVVVGVVGDEAFAEAGDQLLARRGAVVEELQRAAAGLQLVERQRHHLLLRGGKAAVGHLQRRAQLGCHQALLVDVELVERVVLQRQPGFVGGQGEQRGRHVGAHPQHHGVAAHRLVIRVEPGLDDAGLGGDGRRHAAVAVDGCGQAAGDAGLRGDRGGADVGDGDGVADALAVDGDRQLLTGGEVATDREAVGLHRRELHRPVDHRTLGRGEFVVQRARCRLGHRAPVLVADGQGVVQGGRVDPLLLRHAAVVEAGGRPGVQRDLVVVPQVTQGIGRHQPLRTAERCERRARRRRSHTGAGPVDVGIAVVGRHALQETAAHGLAGRRPVVVEHRAGLACIAQRRGHRLLLRHAERREGRARHRPTGRAPGHAVQRVRHHRTVGNRLEEAAGFRVEEAAVGVYGVAVGHCNGVARGLGQVGKHHVVGHRHHVGAAAQHQLAAAEQRTQVAVHRAGVQCGSDGGDAGGVGDLHRRAQHLVGVAGQGVEVVGERVGDFTGVQRHRARRGQRPGQRQLTGGAQHQGGIDAGAQRLGVVVEARARHHRAARQHMDEAAGGQRDRAAVVAGGHGAAFEQREAGAGVEVDAGVAAVVHAGKQAGGREHRMRGDDVEQAAARQRLHRAALVGGEAVDGIAIGDEAALAGAGGDADVQQVVGNRPALHQDLLGHVQAQLGSAQAGIGRAHRRVDVLALDLQRPGVQRQALRGLHVADDLDAVADDAGGVVQPRREAEQAGDAVFDVADAHQHAGRDMADGEGREAVGQGRQVLHAQVEITGGAGQRAVDAVGRLRRTAEAVVLRHGLAAQGERTGADDPVVARGKVDIVGDDGDRTAAAAGADDA